jgi:hypothetical protein
MKRGGESGKGEVRSTCVFAFCLTSAGGGRFRAVDGNEQGMCS